MGKNIALGVIDYQIDFAKKTGKLYVQGGEKLEAAICHLITWARLKGAVIVHSCDQHKNPDAEFDKWPPHCIAGTTGATLIFQPGPTDIVVAKGSFQYSAFVPKKVSATRRTNGSFLNHSLKAQRINAIILTGLAYDFCVGQTALDAAKFGFEVFIVTDCTAAVSETTAAKMRAELDAAGVKHITSAEAKKMLKSIK